MTEASTSSTHLQALFERWQADDLNARDELFEHVCESLRRLTRKMLRRYPHLKRLEETDDVLQNALVNLLTALQKVTPSSLQHFLRLANKKIREELVNLARHYYGPQGQGTKHVSDLPAEGSESAHHPAHEKADSTYEPQQLAAWREFHEQVESLPQDERDAFGLIFYQEMTYDEAAQVLNISKSSIRRYWKSAQIILGESMKDQWPE